jgi:hypothetical protein
MQKMFVCGSKVHGPEARVTIKSLGSLSSVRFLPSVQKAKGFSVVQNCGTITGHGFC